MAVRRIPPHAWTVTARRDVLTAEQRTALAETVRYHHTLTVAEANALLGALALGHTTDYSDWRRDHLGAEHAIKTNGLVYAENGPHRAQVAADVRYSLYRTIDPQPR